MISTRLRIATFFAFLVFCLLAVSSAILIASYHYGWIANETQEMNEEFQKLKENLQKDEKEFSDDTDDTPKIFILSDALNTFFEEEVGITAKVVDHSGNIMFIATGFPSDKTIHPTDKPIVMPEDHRIFLAKNFEPYAQTIIFSEDVSDYYVQEQNLIQKALFISGVSTIILFLVGYLFAWKILLPLRRIAKTTADISLHSLHTRLPIEGPKHDEMRVLSETLNDLLSRLGDSAKNLRQFTQNASHELRTPLAVIDSSLQLAIKTKEEQYIHEARNEIVNMQGLIAALLLLAKAEQKVFTAEEKTKIPVKALIEEILEKIAKNFPEKEMTQKIDIPEDAVVVGEAESVRSIFWNLLWNAYKFTPHNGTVGAQYKNGAISIFDSGKGIKEKDLPSLFERFFRSEETRSTEGFGLGLAITKSLVLANGWEVSAENREEGGAMFTVIAQNKGA